MFHVVDRAIDDRLERESAHDASVRARITPLVPARSPIRDVDATFRRRARDGSRTSSPAVVDTAPVHEDGMRMR
jgi:hypothetical protein